MSFITRAQIEGAIHSIEFCMEAGDFGTWRCSHDIQEVLWQCGLGPKPNWGTTAPLKTAAEGREIIAALKGEIVAQAIGIK